MFMGRSFPTSWPDLFEESFASDGRSKRKQIEVIRTRRLQRLQQQLSGALKQRDDQAEVDRLRRMSRPAQAELDRLKSAP